MKSNDICRSISYPTFYTSRRSAVPKLKSLGEQVLKSNRRETPLWKKEENIMCWYSLIVSGVSWAVGEAAGACGASEEDKKAIEGVMNVTLGAAGIIVDPVGGGLAAYRG